MKIIKFFEARYTDRNYYFYFILKGKEKKFNSNSVQGIFKDVVKFLYDNGYKFDESIKSRRLLNLEEIPKSYKPESTSQNVFKLPGTDKYILCNFGPEQLIGNLTKMCQRFGIDKNTIETNTIDYFDTEDTEDITPIEQIEKSMTFVEAAQYILKKNGNKPMTSYEVWDQSQDFTPKTGKTPWDTMNAQMILYSENSTAKGKKKNSLFRIIEGTRPYKFQLINPDLEVQSIPDEDLDLPKTKAFDYPEDGVLPFTHFRGVQAQEEREKTKPVISPFIDAICILGSSGKGKSYTTELILDSIPNLEYEFIIPSASTTNLLAQFSPGSEKGGYVTSRLGKLIMKAHNNPSKNYVAVFDECHKANVIEMINDELLQCISTKRNKGRRFISLEQEISDLYSGLSDFRGNLLLPDNFGFVFLSSKPDVIISNADFFNRVDIYVMSQRPNEDSVEDAFDYSGGKIKLKEPYFKHFTNSEADQIKTEFDDANNKL